MFPIVKNMGLFRSVMLEPQSGFSLVETKVDKGSQDCPNSLGYSELYTDPRSLILAKKRKKMKQMCSLSSWPKQCNFNCSAFHS